MVHTVARRVSWNDCDPSGRIRYQAAFDWFVDAEVALLRTAGVGDAFVDMPRVAAEATYARPLRFDDPVEVEARVVALGRSSLRLAFRVTADGEEALRGAVTTVHVRDGRAAPLPDRVRAALGGPAA